MARLQPPRNNANNAAPATANSSLGGMGTAKAAGAGALAGFFLPTVFGMSGGGGSASTPLGELVSLLPLLLVGGAAVYVLQVLRK